MREPQAYLGGKFVPISQATIPVSDMGFALGTTVTEQLRTFGGRLFHLEDHLQRLEHSMEIVGIETGLARGEMIDIGERLVAANHALLDAEDDLGLSVFVTPGPYPTLNDGRGGRPCVGMHTYRMPFGMWAEKYERGQAMVTTEVQQVSTHCWPPELKCRSRMHYYLADRAAAQADPGARAILVDGAGHVLEATTASLIVYNEQEGLVAPPLDQVLPGISLAILFDLAADLGLDCGHRPLTSGDVERADEVFLSSTPFCLLPVVRFNRRPVADGQAGDIFRRLIADWSGRVGLDIIAQARKFAERPELPSPS